MNKADEIIKKLEEDIEEYKRRNEMLSNEVNKHIKEGIEKDVEIKEQNDGVIWWTNRFNAVERDKREYKARIDKAIGMANERINYCWQKKDKEQLESWGEIFDILQGSDKE